MEVGCATGKTTLPLARRGFGITCVEIGPNLAAVAYLRLLDTFSDYIAMQPWQAQEVSMTLGRGEQECSPLLSIAFADFVGHLLESAGRPGSRPAIVTVDGRSSSGKTTLAGRLNRAIADSHVVHTDDIAWFHSRFAWTDLMIGNVLEPLHQGSPVTFRPPAWNDRARPGFLSVPMDATLVIIEGVGAARADLDHLVDATIWVQVDLRDVESRNAHRVRSGETHELGVRAWMAEEFPFLEGDRPWERASYIVAGSDVVPYDADKEVIVSARHFPEVSRR